MVAPGARRARPARSWSSRVDEDGARAGASRDGTVGALHVEPGEQVAARQCLVTFEAVSVDRAALDAAELDAFRASARRFVEREIAPHVAAWDEAETFPRALYARGRRAPA